MVKIFLGLLLGVAIGVVCRLVALPLPAPPVLTGAILVVSMTLGYMAMDHVANLRPAKHRKDCGGPTGDVKGE